MILIRYLNRVLLFAFLTGFCSPADVVAKSSDNKSKYKSHKYCDDGGSYKGKKGKKCKYCSKDSKYHEKYCKHKHKCNKYCDCNNEAPISCELYPIAVSLKSLDGIQEGDSITLLSGSEPGEFGWLSWDGYKKDEKELAESLKQPGDSHTYCNPDDYEDSVVSVGDWVLSAYKIKKDKYLSDPLDQLIGEPIVLPIWDKTRGYKSKLAYRVSGFATFTITDYDFLDKKDKKDKKDSKSKSKDSKKSKKSKYSKGYQQSLTLKFLSYTQCDGSGGGNQAPVADDQTVDVDENTPLELILTGSDPDGDSLVYNLTSAPANGTLTGTAPNLIYTPNLNYIGSDSFTFNVFDGDLESEIATVSLEVNIVNEAPIAENMEVSTGESTPIELTLIATDPDGDELVYIIESLPAGGTLEVDGTKVTDVPFMLPENKVTFVPAVDSQ